MTLEEAVNGLCAAAGNWVRYGDDDRAVNLLTAALEYAHVKDRQERKFGPASKEHVKTMGECAACKQPFKTGDYSTLVELGPGDDPEARQRCREGKAHNAVCAVVHWACRYGDEP